MIDAHTARTLFDRLTAEGWTASTEARRLYDSMISLPNPDDQLAAARAALRAASLAGDTDATEAAQKAVGDASNVRAAFETFEAQRREYAVALVRELYAPAFDHVRKLYTATGKLFTDTIAAVDPDTAPDLVVLDASRAVRQAWADAPVLAGDLERLSKLLIDVVLATGRKVNPGKGIYALALLILPGKASVSDLSLAWEWLPSSSPFSKVPPTRIDAVSGGRGGRWAALVRLGATLKCPISAVADYRPLTDEPEPVAVAPVASVATSWGV